MTNEAKLAALYAEISSAKNAVEVAKINLRTYQKSAEHNVFKARDDAQLILFKLMEGWARFDCEGENNFGHEKYECLANIDGKPYRATLSVGYDRYWYDKTFYFVDTAELKLEAI